MKKPANLLVTEILDAHLHMRLLQMTKGALFFHRKSHSYWLVFVTMFSGWCVAYCWKLSEFVEGSGTTDRAEASGDEQRRLVISGSCTVQVISSQGPHRRRLFLCHKVTSFWWLYGQTDWPKFSGLEFTGRDFPPLLTWNYVVEAASLTSLQQR